MNPDNVKQYCKTLFRREDMGDLFAGWWAKKDPVLDRRPQLAAIHNPREVIARAEYLCENEVARLQLKEQLVAAGK